MKNKYDFKETKKHLETITDTADKIKYLLEVKTNYLQSDEMPLFELKPFDKKCNLEINKLLVIFELEKKTKPEN